jgi:hypothetical protein
MSRSVLLNWRGLCRVEAWSKIPPLRNRLLMSGNVMLVASALAGLLWDRLGSSTTLYAGAVFCVVALIGLAKCERGIATKEAV